MKLPTKIELVKWTQSASIRGQFESIFDALGNRSELPHFFGNMSLANQLRTLANSIPQLVWSRPQKQGVDYFNQRWVDYTGLSIQVSLGSGWRQAIHPEDLEGLDKAWEISEDKAEIFRHAYRLRSKDGIYQWFSCQSHPLKNEREEIIRWFGTCTDIHSEKVEVEKLRMAKEKAERNLYQLQDQNLWLKNETEKLVRDIIQLTTELKNPSLTTQERDLLQASLEEKSRAIFQLL